MRSVSNQRLVKQAFRFELDPNREQRVLLAKSVGASRFVYNWGLAESQRAYEATGERPRLRELKKQLVQLKKGNCPWLYEVSAHIGQQALVDLDRAFERFFKALKGEGPKSGFPRFKRRQLAYKCDWYGSTLIVVDRFFPSTQMCSGCGVLNEQVKGFEGLRERRFGCNTCGLLLDRDVNAAINLHRAGLGMLGIVPLPEGLRKVTPDGEEGSGSAPSRRTKPASLKQEATARRNSGETRRSTRQLVEVPVNVGTHRPNAKPLPRVRTLWA
jgi:transposase